MTGDLDDASSIINVQGLTATSTGAKTTTGAYQNFTVTLANVQPKQAVANWQTADLVVGGYSVPTDANMVGTTNVVYSFTVETDGDITLSSITFN